MTDIVVEITFRTIIPFTEDIDPSEVSAMDALDQLQDGTRADVLDSWTLVSADTHDLDDWPSPDDGGEPCPDFAPDTLGDDPAVCIRCLWHRSDH